MILFTETARFSSGTLRILWQILAASLYCLDLSSCGDDTDIIQREIFVGTVYRLLRVTAVMVIVKSSRSVRRDMMGPYGANDRQGCNAGVIGFHSFFI